MPNESGGYVNVTFDVISTPFPRFRTWRKSSPCAHSGDFLCQFCEFPKADISDGNSLKISTSSQRNPLINRRYGIAVLRYSVLYRRDLGEHIGDHLIIKYSYSFTVTPLATITTYSNVKEIVKNSADYISWG